MLHVLIVTDNRILMDRVYRMLDGNPAYKIFVASLSVDAYSIFQRHPMDWIILDTSVYMPYTSVLKLLEGSSWQYNILLMTNEKEVVVETDSLLVIPKRELSKERLDEALGVPLESSEGGYTLIQIQMLHDAVIEDEEVAAIQKACQPLGEFQVVRKEMQGVLFSLSRRQMEHGFTFQGVEAKLDAILREPHSVLYADHVGETDLRKNYEAIRRKLAYCYYIEGESRHIGELPDEGKRIRHVALEYGEDVIYHLWQALFNNDGDLAKQMIQELYGEIIAPYYEAHMLEYVRMHVTMIDYLLQPIENERDKGDKSHKSHKKVHNQGKNQWLQKGSLSMEVTSIKERVPLWIEWINNNPGYSERIQEITLAVYDNYRGDIGLEGLGDACHINKIYFNRLFKGFFGRTVLDVLILLRIQTAKVCLLTTDMKVTDVAAYLGYGDVGYFGKVFKKGTGMSPKSFNSRFQGRWTRREDCESIMAIQYRDATLS